MREERREWQNLFSSPGVLRMSQNIILILQKIKKNSRRPIENEDLLASYIEASLKGEPITFYNWECPPRVLETDEKGRPFLNYRVDVGRVLAGRKLDKYTEIPRVVEERAKEIRILKFLRSLGLNFRFAKIVADTNAYYITPLSLKVLGKGAIQKNFLAFKRGIEAITAKKYPIKPSVYLFTELIRSYKATYEKAFREALTILKSNPSRLIPRSIWLQQLRYIEGHLGFKRTQQRDIAEFAKRTIATYAAEGIALDLLSRSRRFSNCIWFNIEEASDRVITITNCLRTKRGLGKLPMLFLK